MAQRHQGFKGYAASAAGTQSTLVEQTSRGHRKMGLRQAGNYFDPNFKSLAKDQDLGRMELRLLLFSMATIGHENRIPYSQAELAEELGVSRQAVQQGVAQLVRKALVLQQGHRLYLNSRLATHLRLYDLIKRRGEERQELRACGVEVDL